MNNEELRRILRDIDRVAETYIKNAGERENVRDALSDLSEYLLRMDRTVARHDKELAALKAKKKSNELE